MSEKLSAIGKRLKSLMMVGEKKKEFAARIGVYPHQLSRYFNGKAGPSLETARQIAHKTGCDLNWLLTGQGNAYFPNPADIDAGMFPDKSRILGAKTSRPISNQARLQMVLSWVDEMDLPKESRDMLAEMIKDLVLDPDLRIILWEHLRFLKFQKIGKK